MSWVRGETGTLINLAHVAIIEVSGPGREAQRLHKVVAIYPDTSHVTLYTGTREACVAKRNRIADAVEAKVP